jgi:tryptophan synthase alpha chain
LSRYARAGADIIEVGVPFSDPVADGPTIQRASQRALEQGTTLAWTLKQVRAFRAEYDTEVVIFSYLNPVLRYGVDEFIVAAAAAGAAGVLLTDLPFGGDRALEGAIESSPLALVRLIAPTTEAARARLIARHAQGFVYYIARTGVTGARATLPEDLLRQVAALRADTQVPICVGFGISTAEHAAAVGRIADGVVVGSALIDTLDRTGADGAEALLVAMREALPSG